MGCRYINLNTRLQNTIFESTCSRLCAEKSRNEQGTEGIGTNRDRDDAEEKNNTRIIHREGGGGGGGGNYKKRKKKIFSI